MSFDDPLPGSVAVNSMLRTIRRPPTRPALLLHLGRAAVNRIFALAKVFIKAMVRASLETGQTMTDTTPCASLYARTLELARSRPAYIKQYQLAEIVGKKEAWISTFLRGNHPNPSVHDVQKLHDYLVSVRK
jgi:hypothetical protein